MSNKFTEEQYQKIVEIWNNEVSYTEGRKEVFNYIQKEKLANSVYESAAIANPLTREWAHEQFVEKEKKYYWKRNGLYLTKDNFDGSIIFDSYKSLFTESEIIFWGYNPEMFDREEV